MTRFDKNFRRVGALAGFLLLALLVPTTSALAADSCPALNDLYDVCTGGEVILVPWMAFSEATAHERAQIHLDGRCGGTKACCNMRISCVAVEANGELGGEAGWDLGPSLGINIGGGVNVPIQHLCQPFARTLEMNPCNPRSPGFRGREAQCRQQYCTPTGGCGYDTQEACETACKKTHGCHSHCTLSGATAKYCCKKGDDPSKPKTFEEELFEVFEAEALIASTEPLMDVTAFVVAPVDDNCDGREDEEPGDPPRDGPPRGERPGREEEDEGPVRCLDNEPCQVVCPDGTFNQGRRTCYDDGSNACAGVCVSDGDWRPAEDGGGGGCIVEPGAGCPADCASCNYAY